ncbi:MAG: hypothetical protein ACLUNQ_05055 [Oscillospiraceae bacterium]
MLSCTQIIKGGCAELLYVYTDVEPLITFNRLVFTPSICGISTA